MAMESLGLSCPSSRLGEAASGRPSMRRGGREAHKALRRECALTLISSQRSSGSAEGRSANGASQ